jgi:hypothetical protein
MEFLAIVQGAMHGWHHCKRLWNWLCHPPAAETCLVELLGPLGWSSLSVFAAVNDGMYSTAGYCAVMMSTTRSCFL